MYRFLIIIILSVSCSISNDKNDFKHSNILLNESSDQLKAGKYDEATKSALEAIKYAPDNYVAYNNLAVAYEYMDCTFVLVEKTILKSYEQNKEYKQTLINLLTLYFDNGDYQKAIQFGEEYLDIYDGSSSVLNIIGESYRIMDNYDLADKHLSNSIKLDSTHGIALMNMAELQMNLNSYSDAISYLHKARRHYNNSGNINNYSRFGVIDKYKAGILNELSVCFNELEKFDSAIYYVDQAIKIDERPIYLVNKGIYLIKSDSIIRGCEIFMAVEKSGWSIRDNYENREPYELLLKYCN